MTSPIEIWLSSYDRPFDYTGQAEGHHEFLYAIVKKAITSLEPPASTRNQIKKGRGQLPNRRAIKQEPKDPEDSGVDTISDSESETSCSHGDIYSPRTLRNKGSAESLASHLVFSSAYIIKATDANGGPRGNRAAGIRPHGESFSSTPSGGSTPGGGGGGNRSNKRKHHDDQGGESKKPHVDPQEPGLASPCVFFIAEPNASKFQEGGSHAACRIKTFTKISDHNQHNNRSHPPKRCPECKSEIIDTEKAEEDHRLLCGGQLLDKAPAKAGQKDSDRCHSLKDVAEKCLVDLSAYPKVVLDIEFRRAIIDISKAFKLFIEKDSAAQKMKDAIKELFFRSPQFNENIQKHHVLNKFKPVNDLNLDWGIGDVIWKPLWREIPETPGTSDLAEGVDMDKGTVDDKNQPFEAASETGGNDTSTENCLSNPAVTPLCPASIPDAHSQPRADLMNSSPPPSSNPQALAPNASQEDLSDAQLRAHEVNGSSSSHLLIESNPPRNSSQTRAPRRQGKKSAPARKTQKPSAATGPAAAISHASGGQVPSTSASPHGHQRNQWGQNKADQMQSGSQAYQCQPPDRPDTFQPPFQPIQGLHSDTLNYHYTTTLDPRMGGDQVGVGTPLMDLEQDLCGGLNGASAGFYYKGQYSSDLGNETYLQGGAAPIPFNGQVHVATNVLANASHIQFPPQSGSYFQENSPNGAHDGSGFNNTLATKNPNNGEYPRTDQPRLAPSPPPEQATREGWAQNYDQPNPHNNHTFDPSMPTEATGVQPPYNTSQSQSPYETW